MQNRMNATNTIASLSGSCQSGVLLIGSTWEIALSIVTATIAIIALVCAQEGYLTKPLGPAVRLVLIVVGLALMAAQAAFALLA